MNITPAVSWRGFRDTDLALSPVAVGNPRSRVQAGDKGVVKMFSSKVAGTLLACVSLTCIAAGAQGQTTWYVDDDNCPSPGTGSLADPFCSIQDGIVAASDADTVLVGSGTYNETINFIGKAITLRSSEGPEVTTIDATGLNDSVVKCQSYEGPDTVLTGFTITGGYAYPRGGGMTILYSSPTVTGCTFVANEAVFGGGGMDINAG